MLEDTVLLTLKENVDYKGLPQAPSPEDFFLLSRVRGTVSVAQICTASGLGRDKTLTSLERLLDYGLLEVVGGGAAPSKQEPGRDTSITPDATVGTTRPVGDTTTIKPRDTSDVTPTPSREPVPTPHAKVAKPAPIESPTLSDPSFQPISSTASAMLEDDDDDLFMPDSIAHISRVSHRALPEQHRVAPTLAEPPPATMSPPVDEAEPGIAVPHTSSAHPSESHSAPKKVSLFGDYESESTGAWSEASSDEPVGFATISHAEDNGFSTVPAEDDTVGFATISDVEEETVGLATISSVQSEFAVEIPKPRPITQSNEASLDFSRFPVSIDTFEPDATLMSADFELDTARRREILYVHACLEHMTFYQLFGVSDDANRKTIRSSYFLLSKRFHPDLFFRKNVGELGSRAEAVFKHVTKAYAILSNKRKRTEYDELLSQHALMVETVREAGVGPSEATVDSPEKKREMAFQLMVRRATKLQEQGQFLQAAEDLKKAFALVKDLSVAENIAILLLRSGKKLDEAAMFARAVVKQDPDNVTSLVLLGRIYEKNEAYMEALDAFERAQDVAPDDASLKVHVERIRTQIG